MKEKLSKSCYKRVVQISSLLFLSNKKSGKVVVTKELSKIECTNITHHNKNLKVGLFFKKANKLICWNWYIIDWTWDLERKINPISSKQSKWVFKNWIAPLSIISKFWLYIYSSISPSFSLSFDMNFKSPSLSPSFSLSPSLTTQLLNLFCRSHHPLVRFNNLTQSQNFNRSFVSPPAIRRTSIVHLSFHNLTLNRCHNPRLSLPICSFYHRISLSIA